jgi:DNA-binding MarR family transcriptional regulator
VSDGPLHPAESPGLLLWRVTLRWQRQVTAALKPLDLTHVQFVLLASTWWLTRIAGEIPNQRAVAELAGTDPMMTSQVLRALASRGLIKRERDSDDGRAFLLGVSDDGAALASRAVRTVEAVDEAFFAAAWDRPALLSILDALAA